MENRILYNSEEAARIKTITGWVSSTGQYWGNDEHMARWSGCTHLKCGCGNLYPKSYTTCSECRDKKEKERYLERPFKEWNGTDFLVIYGTDEYFFSEEDIIQYCEDNEVKPEDLMLMICEANYPKLISDDYWENELPEDTNISDYSKEMQKLIEALNNYIETAPPISWKQGRFRTEYAPAIAIEAASFCEE